MKHINTARLNIKHSKATKDWHKASEAMFINIMDRDNANAHVGAYYKKARNEAGFIAEMLNREILNRLRYS